MELCPRPRLQGFVASALEIWQAAWRVSYPSPINRSTIQDTMNSVASIYRHFSPASLLAMGKLDLAFSFGRNAVAGRRAISPVAHGLQDIAIAGRTGALKDQRAVYAAVRADDEADFDFRTHTWRNKQGIRRG